MRGVFIHTVGLWGVVPPSDYELNLGMTEGRRSRRDHVRCVGCGGRQAFTQMVYRRSVPDDVWEDFKENAEHSILREIGKWQRDHLKECFEVTDDRVVRFGSYAGDDRLLEVRR